MKLLNSIIAMVVLSLLSLPVTADAFSRRPRGSEIPQHMSPPTRTLGTTSDDSKGSKDSKNEHGNWKTQRPPTPVPEPSTVVLLATGIGGLYLLRRRTHS